MQCVCAQHEQNAAAAADGYARIAGLGLAMTTSGPGATNIVTSVCNAYFDSIPLLCITGQVSRFRLRKSPRLRQQGFQETDVVSIFKGITKYTTLVTDPLMILYELEKALFFATEGRPGPVVLDIPDDLQRSTLDPMQLIGFQPPVQTVCPTATQIKQLFNWLRKSDRPVVIAGGGVHYGNSEKQTIEFLRRFHLPVVLTWGAADLLPAKDPLNMGTVGVCGPRGSNFIVQNADLVIALGTRLSPMITGGKPELFAPKAKKVMVDIDLEELLKFQAGTFTLDLPIHAHLQEFFKACASSLWEEGDRFASWRSQGRKWVQKYPIYSKKEKQPPTHKVNPHFFIKELSQCASEHAIIVGDTGANLSWTLQAFEVKKGQRILSAWNHTPMGYSLPASIGAAFASEGKREIICLIGDGGLMMCLQELGTLRRWNLPIKVFIFNNQGHGIQRQTIDIWLHSHYVAVDEASGLYFPNYEKLAETFSLPYFSLRNDQDVTSLKTKWQQGTSWICNVEISEFQKIDPMLKYGKGLEDLDPPLPREELLQIAQEAEQIKSLSNELARTI